MKIVSRIIFAFSFLLLNSCGTFTDDLSQRPAGAIDPQHIEAWNLVSRLENLNTRLTSFKGIGGIKLWDEDEIRRARVAWMGSKPYHLRIEVLSPAGLPEISISADGKHFYMIFHTQQRLYKRRLRNPSLEKIVSIPIRSSEIISIVGGGAPIFQHYSAILEPYGTEGYYLTLKKKNGALSERILVDRHKNTIRMIEKYDSDKLVYRVNLDKIRTVGGFEVPHRIRVFDHENRGFELNIDTYWANVNIDPSKFNLIPMD